MPHGPSSEARSSLGRGRAPISAERAASRHGQDEIGERAWRDALARALGLEATVAVGRRFAVHLDGARGQVAEPILGHTRRSIEPCPSTSDPGAATSRQPRSPAARRSGGPRSSRRESRRRDQARARTRRRRRAAAARAPQPARSARALNLGLTLRLHYESPTPSPRLCMRLSSVLPKFLNSILSNQPVCP